MISRPQGLSAFLFPTMESSALGTVETPPLMKVIRPATFALWFIIFTAQALSIAATGEGGSWLMLMLSTVLFVGAHVQFWYEESEQGRKVHHALERMRGKMYEDEATGLPNSRHFVFELRRQMMRSVRNGRGFSLVLTDIVGMDTGNKDGARFLSAMGRGLKHASSDGDFIAHLEGPVFAGLVLDDGTRPAGDRANALLLALASCIPLENAGTARPIVALTGYEGELEVRDFLRRAQRDLVSARARGTTSAPVQRSQSA